MTAISPVIPTATTLLGLAGLLLAKRFESRIGVWLTKPLAAAGFIALALVVGATQTTYGSWILIGLVLSFFGDVLLIPENRPAVFKAGIASFLLAHVAYTVAFFGLDWNWTVTAVVTFACAGATAFVLRWLRPKLQADMRVPVYAYVAVISCMLIAAASCSAAEGRPDIFLGALLFYLSDLSVARDRFVVASFWNGAWGLPAYFVGQLVLAAGSGL